MYPADHNPPHFHILANDGKQCFVQISTLVVLQGRVSAAALAEALTWAGQNAATLMTLWTELNP
jgi:deoxyhypusine synthase